MDEPCRLMHEAGQGDPIAASQFMPLIYQELRTIAAGYLRRNSGGSSLQPTALVHEAFVKLSSGVPVGFKSEAHFRAVASMAMRQVLTDYVRRRRARKRGGDAARVTLMDHHAVSRDGQVDLLALHEALERLAKVDARAARVVEMRFFAGAPDAVVAEVLGVSERTVRNDWAMARAWLRCEIGRDDTGHGRDQ